MSFFGFENNDLEKERQKFLQGGLGAGEDIPEVTWGDESYDGLGDTLQEGGDDLNDETFGNSAGDIGKDFDFTAQTLPEDLRPQSHQSPPPRGLPDMSGFLPRRKQEEISTLPSAPSPSSHTTPISLESLWDEKQPSAFSRPSNMSSRGSSGLHGQHPISQYGNVDSGNRLPPGMPRQPSSGMRTLEEVEAEMFAASRPQLPRAASLLELERRQAEEYQRQLIRQEQEREMLILQQHQRERELRRLEQQRLLEQEREALLMAEREREREHHMYLLQQQRFQEMQMQQRGTPPPRMMPPTRNTQSPRFMEHQRQLLSQNPDYLQEQRILLEEQARRDDLERQWMEQQAMQLGIRDHGRQPSGPSHGLEIQELLRIQALQQQAARQTAGSPGLRNDPRFSDQYNHPPAGFPDDIPQSFRASEVDSRDRRALDAQADFKIHETERMMEKRNRLRSKIQHMSRYNDLMTQSDKDFITRIQVSQLVTQDPFADDYYAQMYVKQHRTYDRSGQEDQRLLKFGSGGGIALGVPQKGSNRRVNAMHRMEQQVERIVNNARKREEEKNQHALTSLQGALGKTSGRSYKAAPRQLLSVDLTHISNEATDGTSPTEESATPSQNGKEITPASPFAPQTPNTAWNRRQVLLTLEHLYDIDVKLEDLLRKEPSPDDPFLSEWRQHVDENIALIWKTWKMGHNLDSGTVHPLVFLLSILKGKRLLFKLIGNEQYFTQIQQREFALALMANFDQLDIVRNAPLLDSRQAGPEQEDVVRHTSVFEDSWGNWILYLVDEFDLNLLAGYLDTLMSRNDIIRVMRSSVGLTLVTLFLTNAHGQLGKLGHSENPEVSQNWTEAFHKLLQIIHPHLISLFPSSRLPPPTTVAEHALDEKGDGKTWDFFALLATLAGENYYSELVKSLRDKILRNVASAKQDVWLPDEIRMEKHRNVNKFLNAVGLDSSQIVLPGQ